MLWRYEEGKDKDGIPTGKWIKKPCQTNGYAAKHNDSSTWASFDEVMAVYKQGGFDGIFLALPLDRSLIGGDFDDCLNPVTKKITAPEIADIIKRFNTYTEISPSGSGLRVIGLGCKPYAHKSR